MAASITYFVTAKKPPLFFLFFFLSLALNLCRPFCRWASLACRLLSLFLCLSLALYSKFKDMTINLSLMLWTTRIQKKFPLSVFVFIYTLHVVFSALQDAGGSAISCQNKFELHLGCHTCSLSYFTLVCHVMRTDGGRSVYGHVITKFSGKGRYTYPWCFAGARETELRYNRCSWLSLFDLSAMLPKA